MNLAVDIFLRLFMMIELGLCTMLFAFSLKRRSFFPVRILGVLAVFASVSWISNPVLAENYMINIAYSLVQFLLLYFMVRVCFYSNAWIAVFCCIGGLAVQRISSQLTRFLTGLKNITELAASGIFWVDLIALSICLVAGYFLLAKPIRKNGFEYMENRWNILIGLVFLLGSVILASICNSYQSQIPRPIQYVLRIYDLMNCIYVLWLEMNVFSLDKVKKEAEITNLMWERDQRQMELAKENVDMLNIKCHDMRYLLDRIEKGNPDNYQKDVREMQALIDTYDFQGDTGSKCLNLILNEKNLLCQKSGIQIHSMVDGKLLTFMEEGDLYSLFGNLIDNAIDAVRKLPDEKQRIIKLSVQKIAGMAVIREENFFSADLNFEGGIPVTTAADHNIHGYGTRSIKHIAEKYHGEMEMSGRNGVFTVSILIPVTEE